MIYLALSEHRHDDAVDLAEANWPVLISNNVAALRAVADELTPAEIAARPAWDRIRRYLGFLMLESSMRPVAYVETALPHPPRSLADTLLTLTTRSISARTAGRFGEAVQLARTALERLAEARESDRDALQHRLADGYLQWGLSFEFAVLETEALNALERAYDLGVAFENTRAAADAAGEIAWIHTLGGGGIHADQWIERARQLAASSRSSQAWRRTDVLAAAVRLADRLQPDAAIDMLAHRPQGSVDEHRLVALAQSAVFRMSAGRASTTVLLSELRRAQTSDAPLFAEGNHNVTTFGYIEALVHLYADRPDRSIELLTRLEGVQRGAWALGVRAAAELAVGNDALAQRDADTVISEYPQWPRQLLPALLVKAALALQAGDTTTAVSSFTDACTLAIDNELISSLVIIPHADFSRLLQLAGERLDDPRLDGLARTPLMFAPARRTSVKLSPRELEVLHELAHGGALAAVAARLHLSVNTLKVHNQAIYRKLGVDGREQAVTAARDRGFI
ncbi:helix-turn-helix transcriptional regulator [Gryllotalpicola koreensis]|uniref:HTH luxR-type domain-containing protein n=1 Tax=Gryllotalpicola koreensis TaxID=993086 RepID=A0ABP8A0S2_9MICO